MQQTLSSDIKVGIHPLLSEVLAVATGKNVIPIEGSLADLHLLLGLLDQWSESQLKPFYYWNPGFSFVDQRTGISQHDHEKHPCRNLDDLSGLVGDSGIWLYVMDGENLTIEQQYQLVNLSSQLRQSQCCVFLYAHIWDIPPLLVQDFIPYPLLPPSIKDLSRLIDSWSESFSGAIRSFQGLSWGELHQWRIQTENIPADLALELAQNRRLQKFAGLGLQYMTKPDVPFAGGLEGLESYLAVVQTLSEPTAIREGLRMPKGIVLWGPPGTGKSLSAKLTAQKLGVPLASVDWGGILGSEKPDTTLRRLLSTLEAMAPIVVLFDDFDKGLGWTEGAGGKEEARRNTGKLLTWMQECDAPVFMIATVNRLGMLPAEIIRRFDALFFVDLPNRGSLYKILHLHLMKYFDLFNQYQFDIDNSPWHDSEWQILLEEYKLCTPDEVGKAVSEIARQKYAAGAVGQVTPDDLIRQRKQFTPAMLYNEGQLYEIRRKAYFARSASGDDLSRFAIPPKSFIDD
jgi:hypothetical protein